MPQAKLGWKNSREHFLWFAAALAWFSVGAWRGLTIDEYTTWDNTRKVLAELIRNRLRAGHLPTYFIIEHSWVRWMGDSEFALRFPSILFASLALVFLFDFLLHQFDRTVARLASLLFLTNQVVVWCAQNARPYAGLLLATAIACWGLERWFRCGAKWALVAVTLAVALGTSFYAAFTLTVIALIVALFTSRSFTDKRTILAALSLLVPLIIMLVPVAVLAEHQEKFREVAATPKSIDLMRPINLLARVVFGDYKLWGRGFFRYIVLIFFAVLAVGGWRWLRTYEHPLKVPGFFLSRWGVFSWIVVPLVGLLVTELVTDSNVLSHPRYLVHVLIPVAILEAAGILHWAARLQSKAFARGLLSLSIIGWNLLSTTAWFFTNGDGPRVVAQQMLKNPQSVEAVVGTTLPLEYEWRHAQHPPLIPAYRKDGATLSSLKGEATYWLFIYNNKATPLDDWLAVQASSRCSILKKIEYEDARAFLLKMFSSMAR